MAGHLILQILLICMSREPNHKSLLYLPPKILIGITTFFQVKTLIHMLNLFQDGIHHGLKVTQTKLWITFLLSGAAGHRQVFVSQSLLSTIGIGPLLINSAQKQVLFILLMDNQLKAIQPPWEQEILQLIWTFFFIMIHLLLLIILLLMLNLIQLNLTSFIYCSPQRPHSFQSLSVLPLLPPLLLHLFQFAVTSTVKPASQHKALISISTL